MKIRDLKEFIKDFDENTPIIDLRMLKTEEDDLNYFNLLTEVDGEILNFVHHEQAENICIDFDDTIAIVDKNYNPIRPQPGVKDAVKELRKKFKIIIFSARNWSGWTRMYGEEETQRRKDQMIDFLKTFDIYYDEISDTNDGKFVAKYYIDDRAIEYKENWSEITKRILDETSRD